MTLVLSLGTSDFVVQVSDRRLSRCTAHDIQYIDNVNKAVLFKSEVCFAYTGLAHVDGKTTDSYLADLLYTFRDNDLVALANYLKDQATLSFRRIGFPLRYKRHAFIGVGWIQNVGEVKLYPFLLRISNYFRSGQSEGCAQADDEFSIQFSVFGRPNKPAWGWISTGVLLEAHEKSWLQKRLKRCAEKKTGPQSVARLFTDTVRRVAKRDKSVGSDLLLTVIPREAAGLSRITGLNPDQKSISTLGGLDDSNAASALCDRSSMTFWWMPADSNDPRMFAPAMVWPSDGLSIKDISFRPSKTS